MTLLRFAALTATVVIVAFGTIEFAIAYASTIGHPHALGMDFWIYEARTEDFLRGDGFYLGRQLSGQPYPIVTGNSLYPPLLLYLTVPFALGVPVFLWWAIPVGLIVASIVRWRPPVLVWPLLAILLVDPRLIQLVIFGNPSLWALAFVAAGTVWGWPFVLVILKPTLFPFVVLGATRRGWLLAGAVVAVMCLPFGSMWTQWVTAVSNARLEPNFGLDYLAGEVPIAVVLVLVAWLSRRDRIGATRSAADAPQPTRQATAA